MTKTFTGKPCIRCQKTERYISSKRCVACSAARCKRWVEDNGESHRETQAAWRSANREYIRATQKSESSERKKARHLTRYGISLSQWNEMFHSQCGKCAICGQVDNLHVDHNHATGAVRALLCGTCNRGIGQLKDDPQVVRAAAEYLERHNATRAACDKTAA
jgi:hypothetical protein